MPPPVPPPCPVPFAVVRSRDVGGAADWSGRRHVACRLASLQVSHRRQSASCVRTPCGSAQVQRALASGGCMREAEPGERPGAAVAQSATERVSERTTCMGRICMCEREAAPRGRPRISHDTGDARINDMVPLLVRRWVSFCYCKSISRTCDRLAYSLANGPDSLVALPAPSPSMHAAGAWRYLKAPPLARAARGMSSARSRSRRAQDWSSTRSQSSRERR